jgi:hypothetical protein
VWKQPGASRSKKNSPKKKERERVFSEDADEKIQKVIHANVVPSSLAG